MKNTNKRTGSKFGRVILLAALTAFIFIESAGGSCLSAYAAEEEGELSYGESATGNEPVVAETYTGADNPCITWYVRGLSGRIESTRAYIGTEETAVSESGVLGDEGGYAPKTLILIDNSRSISPYKQEIEDILVRLIWNHQNMERFSIVTFDKEANVLVDYTDNYDDLRLAAEGLTYKDQYTYLRNVLYSQIRALSLDGENDYSRIIIISDGTDDSLLGVTYEELTDLLKDDGSCPIYTIGCTYQPSETGLDKLFALSRRTGSPYFLINDHKDVSAIADKIDEDAKGIRYFSFDIAPELRDGSEKSLSLLVKDAGGEHLITHVSHIPLASADELDALEKKKAAAIAEEEQRRRREEEEAKKAGESEEDASPQLFENADNSPANMNEAETGEGPDDEDERYRFEHPDTALGYIGYYLSQSGLWLILILLACLIAYLRYSRKEQKRKAKGFEENMPAEEPAADIAGSNDIIKGISLSAVNAQGVRYFIGIGEEKVIGRMRARCDISFPEDRAMSARQAVIRVSAAGAELENLDTQAGSIVDGAKVTDIGALRNGSRIRLGSTDLRVTYE